MSFCSQRHCNICVILEIRNTPAVLPNPKVPTKEVCLKPTGRKGLICFACRLVVYCGELHQRMDWQRHSVLCKAVTQALSIAKAKNVYLLDGQPQSASGMEMAIKEAKCIVATLLQRPLVYHESELLSFPRYCEVCFSFDSLRDCDRCEAVSYCSMEHAEEDAERHFKKCCLLQLYYSPYKALPLMPIKVHLQRRITNMQQSNLHDAFQYATYTDVPEVPTDSLCNYRLLCTVSDLSSMATICYALDFFTGGKQLEGQLTMFVVGAVFDCQQWFQDLATRLFFLQHPQMAKLCLYFIGPQAEGEPFKQRKYLFQGKRRTVQYHCYRGLFEDFRRTCSIRPSLIVALSCGFSGQHFYAAPTPESRFDCSNSLQLNPNGADVSALMQAKNNAISVSAPVHKEAAAPPQEAAAPPQEAAAPPQEAAAVQEEAAAVQEEAAASPEGAAAVKKSRFHCFNRLQLKPNGVDISALIEARIAATAIPVPVYKKAAAAQKKPAAAAVPEGVAAPPRFDCFNSLQLNPNGVDIMALLQARIAAVQEEADAALEGAAAVREEAAVDAVPEEAAAAPPEAAAVQEEAAAAPEGAAAVPEGAAAPPRFDCFNSLQLNPNGVDILALIQARIAAVQEGSAAAPEEAAAAPEEAAAALEGASAFQEEAAAVQEEAAADLEGAAAVPEGAAAALEGDAAAAAAAPRRLKYRIIREPRHVVPNTWGKGLAAILEMQNVPILMTNYTFNESLFDFAAIRRIADGAKPPLSVTRLIPIQRNPYRDLRPLRFWACDSEDTIYYRNGYILAIVTGHEPLNRPRASFAQM